MSREPTHTKHNSFFFFFSVLLQINFKSANKEANEKGNPKKQPTTKSTTLFRRVNQCSENIFIKNRCFLELACQI